ncbi:MAG: winged helix-turn-helix domain-containing protein [Chloroflexi bacterium]|mgnify:CR=1 FL=1|nr:winged helix-turn-helix domain-containing protein [Chloroflexota bacterium]
MKTNAAITIDTVRHLLLAVQGVLHPPKAPATKSDVLEIIRRMGALQIDTIHVVARSPYLVLFSRLGDYDPSWLDELLAEGKLFEYWAHAACFLPIEDYPIFRYRMNPSTQRYYSADWRERHQEIVDEVLRRIQADGPVRSADFERTDGKKGTWWDWKVEKQVLEYLHTTGELMIARREKFQRVYDLQQRVLPGWDESQALSVDEAETELTLRGVRALGIAHPRWIHDYFRLPKTGMPKRLKRLVDEGRLIAVDVEGWKEPGYLHPENCSLLEQALAGELVPDYTTLLSPFDPLTWDRERARAIFNFDYTIECYLPEEKRKYGYFSLPILHDGRLIGRLDAKAYRKEGIFEIRSIHLEPGVEMSDHLLCQVSQAIQRCANWHNTPAVEIRRSDPEPLMNLLAF